MYAYLCSSKGWFCIRDATKARHLYLSTYRFHFSPVVVIDCNVPWRSVRHWLTLADAAYRFMSDTVRVDITCPHWFATLFTRILIRLVTTASHLGTAAVITLARY